MLVVKRRFSAFSGSDLEILLRAQEIKHLVLTGIVTSGVVLVTALEAADMDFRITILSDLCADADPDVNDFLLQKVLSQQCDVITSDQWING